MQNPFKIAFFTPLLVVISLLPGLAQAETVHPQQVIQNVTDQLLALLEHTKQDATAEPNNPAFLAKLEVILDPAIDYEKFSKGVMGKYYRKSNDLQHQQFITVFKKSLFAAYGNAFMALDSTNITIQNYKKPLIKKATIKMDVHTSGGKIFPVSYSMHLTKKGEWKVKNVIVNGMNLGLTFKNQFLGLMSKHRDIDKAIQNWSSDLSSGSS
ncbi:MAG: ABC transporter substrate-binding protein [Pseudomonadales bacterium]|nr:ABC transporter substrate-binding protein [Pseudomonadales bacterium]